MGDQDDSVTDMGQQLTGEPQKEKCQHRNNKGHNAQTHHQSSSPYGDTMGMKKSDRAIQ